MIEKHPPYNCEDCGITHTSYESQIEYAHKNRKARNILIVIVFVSFISIPLGLTVFDLIKSPDMLYDKIDRSLFERGYDVICHADYGMQYCMIDDSESNNLRHNENVLYISGELYPCLNIHLTTSDAVTDRFLVTEQYNCIEQLEFPVKDGWNYYWIVTDSDAFYEAEKRDPTFWWDDSYNELLEFKNSLPVPIL